MVIAPETDRDDLIAYFSGLSAGTFRDTKPQGFPPPEWLRSR
jgi:hypothetical protein